jgi:hypothetical protein
MSTGSVCIGVVVACPSFAMGAAGPGTQVEDAADQTPTIGDVGGVCTLFVA